MHGKIFSWGLRVALALLVIAGYNALGGDEGPVLFTGVINDFTAAHDAKGNASGPWELHGDWQLKLRRSAAKADFSTQITMEDSDYWLLINPNPPADPDNPGTRTPHTHHITFEDGDVTFSAEGCPTAGYKPPTTTGFMVTHMARVTANGGPAPFAPENQLSELQVCVTGGTDVGYSNITLVFGMPASTHFGMQPINGVVRGRRRIH
jgi:hypothetical protein